MNVWVEIEEGVESGGLREERVFDCRGWGVTVGLEGHREWGESVVGLVGTKCDQLGGPWRVRDSKNGQGVIGEWCWRTDGELRGIVVWVITMRVNMGEHQD